MDFYNFINKQKKDDTVMALDNKRFWVTACYISTGLTLQTNTKPTEVKLIIDAKIDNNATHLSGETVYNYHYVLYRIGKFGQTLKSTVPIQNNTRGSEYVYIFDNEPDAVTQYNSMVRDIQHALKERVSKINTFQDQMDTELIK